MYNRMRRIFVALGAALPLIAVVPASHAQTMVDGGLVSCNVVRGQNFGIITVNPPRVDPSSTNYYLGWTAWVHQWDANRTYLGKVGLNRFYYTPGGTYGWDGGTQWTDAVTGKQEAAKLLSYFSVGVVRWVQLQHYLWYWQYPQVGYIWQGVLGQFFTCFL